MDDEGLQNAAVAPQTTPSVPEPIFKFDDSLQVLARNEAAVSVFDCKKAVGKDVRDLQTVGNIFEIAKIENALESGQTLTYERYLPALACWYEIRLYPENGCITAVCLDRTEQKSEQISQENSRFRALVEHGSDFITHLGPDGTITYVSPTVEDVLSHGPKALVGANALAHVHPDDEQTYLNNLNGLLETPDQIITFQYRFADGAGSYQWVESTGTNRLDTAEIEGLVLVNRKITDRKQYENRLERQRDNLRLLNQVVRHDIRNDLQLIVTHGELLEEHVGPAGDDSLAQILASAENAVERTEDARTLADVILQSEQPVGTRQLRGAVHTEIERSNASYESGSFRVAGSIPDVTVQANEMLDSVFDNLFTNAVVHNNCENPAVTVSAETTAEWVTVRVRDNGPGIPDARNNEIFGRGEKGLDSNGTGIGLYLVETIVDQYGGEVWAENQEQGGAEFAVKLPLAE